MQVSIQDLLQAKAHAAEILRLLLPPRVPTTAIVQSYAYNAAADTYEFIDQWLTEQTAHQSDILVAHQPRIIMEYSIAIYRNGSLIYSYITEPMDEACIDEHITATQDYYFDCEVHCIEYEKY